MAFPNFAFTAFPRDFKDDLSVLSLALGSSIEMSDDQPSEVSASLVCASCVVLRHLSVLVCVSPSNSGLGLERITVG